MKPLLNSINIPLLATSFVAVVIHMFLPKRHLLAFIRTVHVDSLWEYLRLSWEHLRLPWQLRLGVFIFSGLFKGVLLVACIPFMLTAGLFLLVLRPFKSVTRGGISEAILRWVVSPILIALIVCGTTLSLYLLIVLSFALAQRIAGDIGRL